MATFTISLPDSLKDFVQKQMESKGYDNVSEYFRTLIRQAQVEEEEGKLDILLRDGLMSGKAIPVDEKFWKELRADAERLRRKSKK